MPLITTRDSTSLGGRNRPSILLWISFPRIVPNLIPSSECGSSHVVVACTIVISKISETSSTQSRPNSQLGQPATRSCDDYAQLLKTLCLIGCFPHFRWRDASQSGTDRMSLALARTLDLQWYLELVVEDLD